MFAIYGRVCWICGHGGAGEADHLIPVSVWSDQPIDPHAMRPSHGSYYPCPHCPAGDGKGRACNQERGTTPAASVFRPALSW